MLLKPDIISGVSIQNYVELMALPCIIDIKSCIIPAPLVLVV